MLNSLVILLIAIVGFVVVLFILINKNRRMRELKVKTDFAVKADELVRVEMSGEDTAASIARNFNTIGQRISGYKKSSTELSGIKEEKQSLDNKIKNFEDSLSQLNVLTDIGRQITSCLNVKDIALKLYHYINSSMIAEEVNILIVTNNDKKYYHVFKGNIEEIVDNEWSGDKDNILNWSFDNNKEAFLNNASDDYAQYVFKPLILHSGAAGESVIGIPLSLSNNMIGSVSVMCTKKNAFSDFHLDFARSMASYVSVAIYNANLYGELGEEKQKSEDLLLNILPEEVAHELKQKGRSEARQYENVTVLFTDFVNFTGISAKLSPKELVSEIDYCFNAFDEIIGRYGLEKIKTIGDAYLAVCGLPNENKDHAANAVHAAKEIRDFINAPSSFPSPDNKVVINAETVKVGEKAAPLGSFRGAIRIGLNSGPVVAGIVGSKKFAYDIWGDTVNVASRMESNSEVGKINISGSTHDLIKDRFKCEYRGKINAKNRGDIDMYFVE